MNFPNKKCILVTGGCGFIGSNFIDMYINKKKESVINLDVLTYSSNLRNLEHLKDNQNYRFVAGDICDKALVKDILVQYCPTTIVHFAAESHVDRSIHSAEIFIKTNIQGTYNLLELSKEYWMQLSEDERSQFRFIHVSTDEVYGSLEVDESPFTEKNQYKPNSPYAASKAASDHLARAWFHTYGLPVITTNCSNNYGPYQFPEKLIPLTIINALSGKRIPIYADGQNKRDWLYVDDHCAAINTVIEKGIPGEVYNIGANNEQTNLDLVLQICSILDRLVPIRKNEKIDKNGNLTSYKDLIEFTKDRPGHDKRYAINAEKIVSMLGWSPKVTFLDGLNQTIQWYLSNQDWLDSINNDEYKKWINVQYA